MHRCLVPAALVFALSLVSCASSDSIVKVYEDAAFEGGPFNKVLVVGVHEDSNLRRRFENALASEIGEGASDATASLSVMQASSPIDRDSVLAAVREIDADAVMITRVLDVERSVTVDEGRSTTVAQRRDDIPLADFFRYDYVMYTDPMTVSTVYTVILSTDLYNVSDETRIWSVESSSFEKEDAGDIIESTSRTISMQLRRDGLIL